MPRSYDPDALTPLNPADPDWAREWVRFLLRQVPDSEGKFPELGPGDGEIEAALLLDAVRDGVTPYYRPHFTAARLYLGNPELLRSEGGQGWSNTRRDAAEITGAWLAQGRAFDALIPSSVLLLPFVTAGETLAETGRQQASRPGSIVVPITGGW